MTDLSRKRLGWSPFFAAQMEREGGQSLTPARVMDFYMREVEVHTGEESRMVPLLGGTPPVAVGDWVLLHPDGRIVDVLDRSTVFRRKAAGTRVAEQVVAANVDTAFIVCSLNEDFSLNRLERYLSLVHESGAEPVVLLSKKDLCEDPATFCRKVQELDPLLGVEALDAREETAVEVLSPWCREGQTIVLVGSSGSGKSTLTNTLMGRWVRETGEIKDTDGKGRHTTTRRSMFQLPGGALVLDTPGMRELQLTACETGVATTFSDIEAIAASCKFNDCKHETEPGCAVKAALEEGALTERRLQSYLKLMLEQERNAASLAQRHAANRRQTRDYLRSQAYSRQRKGSE